MPNPQPGESEQEFISRCIPIVLDDGTAKDDKQAAAICYSLYRGKASKEGRRNATADLDRIQKAHDLLSELGAACKAGPTVAELLGAKQSRLFVFKDATGKYRWVTFSSSAFRDRDLEIVSRKALAADVERADTDGDYGPLRWWHVDGVDFGLCDFNAMEDRVLVESGTFYDEGYGEALKDADLEVSIGFYHPAGEPDAEGVFHTIRRFERSLVPAGKASNLLTAFLVEEKTTMDEKKETILRKLLGPLADKLLGAAKEAQKEADAAGLTFKAEEPAAQTPAPEAAKPEEKPAEPAPAPEAPKAEEKAAAPAQAPEPPKTIGQMSPEQLADFVMALMKPEMDGVKAQLAAKKEAEDKDQAAHTAIAAQIAEINQAVKNVADGVAELQGEAPRAQTKGYRASQDSANVTAKKEGPVSDAFLNEFMPFVMGQKGQGQP